MAFICSLLLYCEMACAIAYYFFGTANRFFVENNSKIIHKSVGMWIFLYKMRLEIKSNN